MALKRYRNPLMRWTLTFGVILITLSESSSGYATEDDFLRLYNNLTSNYNRHMRPVANQTAPVMIDMDFNLFFVSEMKDTESTISVINLMQVSWYDHNLVWNPQNYGGIDSMRLTEENIWAPIVSLYLSQSSTGSLFESETTHSVSSNGLVSFSNAGFRSTFCYMDMTYFPYDYQKCDFNFIIIDASILEVDFSKATASLSYNYVENKEWLVMNITASLDYYGYQDTLVLYRVTIILQRRPTFNSLNIIAPAIIICILCMLTFLVPLETGERLSYTLTTVLSLSVYITYIGALIPNSSHPVPVLFQYVVSLFIICGITVLLTLIIIKVRWSPVQNSVDKQKYIRFFGFQLFFPKMRWLNKDGVLQCKGDDGSKTNVSMESGSHRHDILNVFNETCEPCNRYADTDVINPQPEHKWKRNLQSKNVNMDETNEDSTKHDAETQLDNELLKLCHVLDAISFILTFLTFVSMTLYTLMRFDHQEIPSQAL